MKRALLALLLVASPAFAQANGWAEMANGWGEIQTVPGFTTLPLPSGCTTGSVATFLGSLTCAPGLTWASGTLSVPGAVSAQNFNAIPLPASGAVTVEPKLSPLGGITVVAGSALVDGDALSVGDGTGIVPIEFDAAPGDGTTGGAVPIIFDGTETATQIRDAVKAILDGAGRDWTTSNQGADGIGLVRATPGATGGAIVETVTAAGFTVTNWTDPTHATTYTYSLQACAADGACTAAGAASSTAAGVATLSAAQLNRLSWSAVTGAASYKIRRDVGGATQGVIWSGTALTVDDTGLAGDSSAKPTTDGTGTLTGRGVLGNGTTVGVGTGTATARVGGVLAVWTGSVTTTGTNEEILQTYQLAANSLARDGQALRITLWGVHAANTNSASLIVRIGGIGGTVIASRASSSSSAIYRFTAEFVRTGASTQVSNAIQVAGTATLLSTTAHTATLANDNAIVFTGATGTAAGDVTLEGYIIEALN